MKKILLAIIALLFAAPAFAQPNMPRSMADYPTIRQVRMPLTANTTWYVLKTGNDANTCLVNSAGGACLTIQGALNKVAQADLNGYIATVQIADTGAVTYTETLSVPIMVGQKGTDYLVLTGNVTTPTNLTITSAVAYTGTLTAAGGKITLAGGYRFKNTDANGYCMVAQDGGVIHFSGASMDFGGCGSTAVSASSGGAIRMFSPYTVSAGGAVHYAASGGGQVYSSSSINFLSSVINYGGGFALGNQGGNMLINGGTFTNTGSITGKRYSLDSNATIQTYGAGATYLPGDTAGTAINGGVYQ